MGESKQKIGSIVKIAYIFSLSDEFGKILISKEIQMTFSKDDIQASGCSEQ